MASESNASWKASSLALQRITDTVRTNETTIWVFCGDSITHGAVHTYGARDYVELIEERVRYELDKSLNLFVNSASSGDTTVGILQTLQHRILRFTPDIFSLMVGINDCASARGISPGTFEANVKTICSRARDECGAEILLHTCCAIKPEETPQRTRYPQYMDVVRQVAADLDAGLIDHEKYWKDVLLSDEPTWRSWLDNPFHPNAMGHWVFAELILKELGLGSLERCRCAVAQKAE